MSKYIDAEKLKSIIKVQIAERKKWMKDIDKSDRQDQLWSDLNEEDISILNIITSLQQEQPEVDLEKEIDRVFFKGDCGSQRLTHKEIALTARHFYELGLKARKEEK